MDGEQAGDGAVDGPLEAGTARPGLAGFIRRLPRHVVRVPILFYRYTLSSFMGRQCRYLPTCSEYAEEAVVRPGAPARSVLATAPLSRGPPWGGHGYDPVPRCLPAEARWYRFWRYGVWRMPKGTDDAG